MAKKIEDMFIRLDRMYERDRRTDRRTPHYGIGRACMASRGNKMWSIVVSPVCLWMFVTSAKDVVFLLQFVCRLVCLSAESVNKLWTNFQEFVLEFFTNDKNHPITFFPGWTDAGLDFGPAAEHDSRKFDRATVKV